jgi:hypothetical protein
MVPVPGRPRASSLPVFSVSATNGRSYIDSAHNKREYENKPETAFNRLWSDELKEWRPPKDTDYFFENVEGEPVISISSSDVRGNKIQVSSTGGSTYIASYSMKETKMNEVSTIYVPGRPPLYRKPHDDDFPLTVPHDTGISYIDEHAGRFPKFQSLPLFRALTALNPDFRFPEQKVHVVMNRTTALKFIHFFKNAKDQSFHVELVMVENTLFIHRKTRYSKGGSAKKACGRNFEATLTVKDDELDDATSHHRYTMYPLGPLNIVCRYEVDGYMVEDDIPEDPSRSPCQYPDPPRSGTPSSGESQYPDCVVIHKGTIVKQDQLVEMKSNESSRPMEQMWLGRTSIFVGGKGKCKEGDNHNIYSWRAFRTKFVPQSGDESFEKEEASWRGEEGQHKEYLEKMVWFLQKLRDTVDKMPNSQAILVSLHEEGNNHREVAIYETKQKIEVAPKEVIEQFWSKDE